MILFRVVAHKERAGLFRAGPFMNLTAHEVGVWIRIGVTEWNSRSRLV